jgi:Flp pilus assembly protein TadD/cytochrome c553
LFRVRLSISLLALSLGSLQATASHPVTFNKDIAPILFAKCAQCHRAGESGPFPLLTYQDAEKRAAQIRAVTASRYMPPWLPDPVPGGFADEHRLTDQEIQTIARWVDQGSPEGAASDPPPVPHFVEGWQLGEPDLVLTLPSSYTLPASGPDVYRNFVFTFPLEGTRYVRAIEIRPASKRVVHHANVLIDRNRSMRWRDGKDGQPGFAGMDLKIESNVLDPESHFLFWKPGSAPDQSPPGMGWMIEKGTDLILNMHMQPTGKPEKIQPVLGLYFGNDEPRYKPLLVQLEADRDLSIPAGRDNFSVEDDFTIPVDTDLLAIYPHAHYLGKTVVGTARLPDGSERTLIRIRDWDLNWQGVYRYRKPVFLPKGTRVSMRWTFDNSASNPRNPSQPPRRVTAGDQATDEMAHLWLQLLPRGDGDQRPVIQEALMRKRIAQDPQDFTAHFNLGGLLEARGDTAGAIAELELATAIAPKDEVALNTLGAYLQLAGRADDAEKRYRAALTARPDYTEARYNLAQVLLARGANEDATAELRTVVLQTPDDTKAKQTLEALLEQQANALARERRLGEATVLFREIAALDPTSAGAYTNLGAALAMQGNLAAAREQFEKALAIDPASSVARDNLARVKAQLR